MGFNRSSSPAPPPPAPVVSRDRMEGDYNPAVKKSREEAQRQFYNCLFCSVYYQLVAFRITNVNYTIQMPHECSRTNCTWKTRYLRDF